MAGNLTRLVSAALLSGALLAGCSGGEKTTVAPESGSAVPTPPATPVVTNPGTPAPSTPTTPPVSETPAVAGNNAPTITGTPATSAVVGSAYGFAPAATDADNDVLSWSISGKPSDASFSASTGQLSWTPGAAGTWPDIVITVTDAKGATASLPAFSITVPSAEARGVATLNWNAPTEFTDGSLLPATELGGYRVFHGATAENLSPVAEVDSLATSLTVQDLVAGTHYFAVAAISASGEDGEMSPVLAKSVL